MTDYKTYPRDTQAKGMRWDVAPLTGVRVVELGGIGPAPWCGMVLADLGADVVAVSRPGSAHHRDEMELMIDGVLERGRERLECDFKDPEQYSALHDRIVDSDIVLEGFRPGVLERLGFGPHALWKHKPALVIGRVTGWGQDGPKAQSPGHDINFLALSGALAAMGAPHEVPPPPLNLVADFGGGGLLLAFGVVAALLRAGRTGSGSVVDAAMLDGASLQMTMMYELFGRGRWNLARQSNINDGGAPFYRTYATADGKFVAVGAMERRFYNALVELLGLAGAALPDQWDRARWPELSARFAQVFRTRTRSEWTALLEHEPVCVTPVLDLAEATQHPHHLARDAFNNDGFGPVPRAAPRFGSAT